MRRTPVLAIAVAVLLAIGTSGAATGTVAIQPSMDNTLFEDSQGALSNGAGIHFFAGKTAINELRRGLIAFDIAGSVPPGVTITDVTLTMNMSKTIAGPASVSLHRVGMDWGEGTADAPGQEGTGTTASGGDATWLHTFSPTEFWLSPGGDFDAFDSATTVVSGINVYTWGSTPDMIADVSEWRDDPANNFGWLVIVAEPTFISAKRFDSRESDNPPVLRVTWDDPGSVPATSAPGIVVAVAFLFAASAFVLRRRTRNQKI